MIGRWLVRRFWRCESGASALEFALIALPLVMLTFGIIEFARLLFVNGGVNLGHVAAQNWATFGLRGTRVMGGGQSAALSI